ncbi:Ammonium transporter Rh type B like protein [Argiope bruennichi]|uniref:Ammonium transporter Rh type B like protein n=1 Tax=Argiope bruennichi TaxID=94029 RepID=A0A8T0FNE1_ARGBR|nr:Ammonium transporter Rh type B like protein [Argiope bruennichi]
MVRKFMGISDIAAAAIASAALQHLGIITEEDKTYVINRMKIRSARSTNRRVLIKDNRYTQITENRGLFFDGRKDITIVQEKRGSHVTPKSGNGKDIAYSILKFLKDREHNKQLLNFTAVGCDGTIVNTGYINGVISLMEKEIGRPLKWLIYFFHYNELPLRHLFCHLDDITKGLNEFKGEIGQQPENCVSLPVVIFLTIENNLPLLEDKNLSLRNPGKLALSRWLTLASRLLRLYVTTENPKILAEYVVKVVSRRQCDDIRRIRVPDDFLEKVRFQRSWIEFFTGRHFHSMGYHNAGLISGNFASATVLISFGALLGKTSPLQLVIMSILEITIFACNEHLGLHIYKAADIGGSIFLHTFGAYFGLSVAYMLYRKEALGHTKDGSNYHSDIFAMIGTIFLWMFWPSFNSALATGEEQHRSVINTFVALLVCCTITFAISSLVDGEGRLNMVHIQNATLAGGVAIGSTSNMIVHPFGAMIIGALAAIISTIGYRVATPYLAKHMKIHDTCGVNNLHGMPGILAGLVSAVVAAAANEKNYGYSLYQLYPARSPLVNTTEFQRIRSVLKDINSGEDWSEASQAYAQLEALFTTLAVAIAGGIVTGYVIRSPIFDPPKKHQIFDDTDYWEVPEDDP